MPDSLSRLAGFARWTFRLAIARLSANVVSHLNDPELDIRYLSRYLISNDPGPGFEPGITVSETIVMPFHYPGFLRTVNYIKFKVFLRYAC